MNMIIELEPHYIKLDHYFSINLSKSRYKQEMIKSLLHYSEKFDIQVDIEGIESESDLVMAKRLGISHLSWIPFRKTKANGYIKIYGKRKHLLI
ncbi:MAG: EAL domain-containing protein [Bacillota bacterium]|nr:EAL domain-containing protein [Bacillota bacterium]